MLAHERVEAGDELGQAGGVDGRVLDEGEGLGVAADAHENPEPGLAHAPHAELLGGVEAGDGGVAEVFRIEGGGEGVQFVGQFAVGVAVELDEE